MYALRCLFLQLFLLGWIFFGFGQSKVWYFGKHAGIDFSISPPISVAGPIHTTEGCAIVSNQLGEVILSTDGSNLHNENGQLMYNGLKGSSSSTHSAIVVPHPANPCSRFFIFTVPSAEVSSYPNGMHVLDVKVENGDIQIRSSRKLLENSTEKLAATNDGNGGYWVVGHDYVDTAVMGRPEGKQFFAFHITANSSIQTLVPVISETSTAHQGRSPWSPGNYHNSVGQMKFNKAGDMLALAIYWDQVLELLRFDKNKGTVHDLVKLDEFAAAYPERSLYGLEFSASGYFLYTSSAYVSDGFEALILGFDIRHLNKQLIWDSRIIVAKDMATSVQHYPFGALQMGPDGKIYIARPFTKYVASLSGNSFGTSGQYRDSAIALTDTCLLGLPTLIKVPDCSYGTDPCEYLSFELGEDTSICQHDSVILGVPHTDGLSYRWSTGEVTPTIVVAENGIYKLTVSDTNGCRHSDSRRVNSLLYVAEHMIPKDTTVCEEVNARFGLSIEGIKYKWLDGSPGVFHEAHQSGPVEVRLYGVCDTLDYVINLEVEDCRCKVYVPNAFTPDGDEHNERHKLKTSCQLQDFKFTIFSRWGNVVFETNDIRNSWDGQLSNGKVEGGVYIYKLAYKAKDNEWQYDQGTVTVLK